MYLELIFLKFNFISWAGTSDSLLIFLEWVGGFNMDFNLTFWGEAGLSSEIFYNGEEVLLLPKKSPISLKKLLEGLLLEGLSSCWGELVNDLVFEFFFLIGLRECYCYSLD